MENLTINYTLVTLIDILGLVQALLLGGLLLFGSREKKPLFFLSVVVLTSGLELVEAILSDTGITLQVPRLFFLPLNFHFLTFPAFYLYTKSLVQPVSVRANWRLFLPAILEFVARTVLFLLPVGKKVELVQDLGFLAFYQGIPFASLFYNIFFAYLTIRLVNRHQRQAENFFSDTTNRLLVWVKLVAVLLIVFMVLWIPFDLLPERTAEVYAYPILSAINVVFIFWLALVGFKQSLVYVPQEFVSPSANGAAANGPTAADGAAHAAAFEKIQHFLEKEKPYTNPQLLLSDLAEQLAMPQRTVSEAINTQSGTNFSQFINQYRVEEAKRLMMDPAFSHLSLLGIGYEVGFNSKTSFYTTFKSMAGLTPSQFQKQSILP